MAAELPIEQPTRLELIVNAKTAKAQGIEIPSLILAQAKRGDRVGFAQRPLLADSGHASRSLLCAFEGKALDLSPTRPRN